MKRTKFILLITAMMGTVAVGFVLLPSNIDPTNKWAWGENLGWMNWHDAGGGGDGVIVGTSFLSGLIWGENLGWINVGDGTPTDGAQYANINGSDFGVNIDPGSGELSGMAWGENAGWINFDTTGLGADRARIDIIASRFRGYAWGENIGWINLDDGDHFVAFAGACNGACVWDIDLSGDVRVPDLIKLLSCWGPLTGDPVCACLDIDTSTDIRVPDLIALLAKWGVCP